MKKLILSILTLTALSFGVNAQNTSAFQVNQEENFGPGGSIPKNYASIQTLAGSNLRLTGNWTLEAWIKIVVSMGETHIIETYSSGSTGGFTLRVSNGRIKAHQITNQSSSISTVTGTTAIPSGEWHHIAATLNETTNELKVYLDGVLEGTTTTTLNTLNNNSALYIGARGDDQDVNGITEIDNVRIWNIAKTESQIQADTLACLTGNENGLLAWYDFENITSSSLIDKSNNGNNGSLVNYDSFQITSRTYNCHFPTSITEVKTTTMNISPNPTKNFLNINTTDIIKQVTIYNISGSLIKNINQNVNHINVEELVEGMYILVIKTDNGITRNRFIKE